MSFNHLAGALSGAFAIGSAAAWFRVVTIKTPRRGLTADMVDFDWLTEPLARQAFWNRIAAGWAGVAALLQVAAALA